MTQNWDRLKLIIKKDSILIFITISGLLLRLRQYAANRSFWGDEGGVALNIVERSFFGLTQKLGFHQAAPLGFLFIEKLSIILLGNRDYIFRLFPLLCGLLAVYLMYLIVKEYFVVAGIFALLIFAINSWLIYYSSELKQYCGDVTVTLLLIYLSFHCLKEDTRPKDFLWLGLAGFITIWISHISIFILAGIGITLFFDKVIQKEYRRLLWVIGLGVSWLLSFGIEYIVTLQYTIADGHYQTAWLKSFMPLPPTSEWAWNIFYKFMLINLNRTDLILAYLFIGLILIGCVALFARNWKIGLIVLFPFIMTLAASALHKYPLSYRFMLFLMPSAFLFIAEAIRMIYQRIAKWQPKLGLVLCAVPAVILLWVPIQTAVYDVKVPETVSEIRPVVQYVSEKKQPQDIVYIYYGSVPSVLYYAPQYGFTDTDSPNVIQGIWRQNDHKALERFFEDVGALKGKERVWFIFSDFGDCGGCTGDKRVFFNNYIGQYGIMLDKVEDIAKGAYLYDLKP